MRRNIYIAAAALACVALFVSLFHTPALAQFRPQYAKNLASYATADVACELDVSGVCQQVVSVGNPLPAGLNVLNVLGAFTQLQLVASGAAEVEEGVGVVILTEDMAGNIVRPVSMIAQPTAATPGLVVRNVECHPDLSTDETCLSTCLADGSVTANVGAGAYLMSAHGETTWIKNGVTLAAGGTRYVVGTQIPVTIGAATDLACRSAGGTGSVCFIPCL